LANTTFNPSDKAAGITLSGGNLIATNNNSTISTVRAVDKQVSGKWYWEYTCNTFANNSSGVGIEWNSAPLNSNVADTGSVVPGKCGVARLGQIAVDGNSTGITFGTIANGAVICVAVDLTARLVWFRLGAAGNWNNNATYNPATGTGGVSIFGLGGGIPAFPAVTVAGLNDQVTANFGDTAFTGTVPSGFTSGFTAGATVNTNALATQVAVEHWLRANPQAQVTQVALEHWASVAAALPSTQNISITVMA
jgi:hypothetical protein